MFFLYLCSNPSAFPEMLRKPPKQKYDDLQEFCNFQKSIATFITTFARRKSGVRIPSAPLEKGYFAGKNSVTVRRQGSLSILCTPTWCCRGSSRSFGTPTRWQSATCYKLGCRVTVSTDTLTLNTPSRGSRGVNAREVETFLTPLHVPYRPQWSSRSRSSSRCPTRAR